VNKLPSFRAAAVQAAPVFLDVNATVDKACDLIGEASRNGAELVAFPEVFVCAYPYWSWIVSPIQGSEWFQHLYENSIEITGPEVQRLTAAARKYAVNIVIGINERDPLRIGTLFNTNLVISADGELLGRHRKLVPTWAEKLVWSGGDGSTIKVYDTNVGPLGTLACGENTNPLARFALLSQGELVHVANYISLPVAPKDYNMAEAIKLRGAAHSFEGKVFTVVSCSTISEEIIEQMQTLTPDARELLSRRNSAFSGILGPDGNLVGDGLVDDEGIVYADIDLNRCIQPKQMHDILGHYNRFDVFDLKVNRTALQPTSFVVQEPDNAANSAGDPPFSAPGIKGNDREHNI
jgi:aliphatic nitrilase